MDIPPTPRTAHARSVARPFPETDQLRSLVELACTAPSVHNTQPWQWRVVDRGLHLHADLSRQLMFADASRRSLVLSCGAALHTLEVAAAAAGWRTTTTRAPHLEAEAHLARVTFSPGSSTAADLALAEVARARHTDRRPPSSWPVPQGRFDHLVSIAAEYGVLARGDLAEDERHILLKALGTAARHQSMNDAYLDELLAWTQRSSSDGVPPVNLPTRDADDEAGSRFPAGELPARTTTSAADMPSPAQWLVLSTSSDDPLSWLRAGEALAAIWLHCAAEGLSLVPYSQPLEVESVRASLQRSLLDDRACPQAVLRIGWAPLTREAPPETPRRAVDEVLVL